MIFPCMDIHAIWFMWPNPCDWYLSYPIIFPLYTVQQWTCLLGHYYTCALLGFKSRTEFCSTMKFQKGAQATSLVTLLILHNLPMQKLVPFLYLSKVSFLNFNLGTMTFGTNNSWLLYAWGRCLTLISTC